MACHHIEEQAISFAIDYALLMLYQQTFCTFVPKKQYVKLYANDIDIPT